MLKEGLKMSIADPAVFYKYNNGPFEGFLAVHVDDFYWSGTKHFEKTVISRLRSNFQSWKREERGLHICWIVG